MRYTTRRSATLIETVMDIYKGISKQKAKQILGYSDFFINGVKVLNHPKLVVDEGANVEVVQRARGVENATVPSRKNPVAIHFEDNDLLIALKPPGILSCRDQNQETAPSFHKLLEAFLVDRDRKKTRLWPIHRLDKEVEGLIIFAKSEQVQQMVKGSWQENTKRYLALTEAKPNPEHGIIETWLKDGINQKMVVYSREVEGAQLAKTEYHYLRPEHGFHLVEVCLHTGKKNQIRVHLSHIGCPIVGDRKYGADGRVNRQIRLSAYKLELKHPISGQPIALEYLPPARFFKPSGSEDENYRIV